MPWVCSRYRSVAWLTNLGLDLHTSLCTRAHLLPYRLKRRLPVSLGSLVGSTLLVLLPASVTVGDAIDLWMFVDLELLLLLWRVWRLPLAVTLAWLLMLMQLVLSGRLSVLLLQLLQDQGPGVLTPVLQL